MTKKDLFVTLICFLFFLMGAAWQRWNDSQLLAVYKERDCLRKELVQLITQRNKQLEEWAGLKERRN